jgi:hypothetical protein
MQSALNIVNAVLIAVLVVAAVTVHAQGAYAPAEFPFTTTP